MRAVSKLWCELGRTPLPASRRILPRHSRVHLAAASSAPAHRFQTSPRCLCTGPPASHVTKQQAAADASSPPSSDVTADAAAPDRASDVTPLARQLSARIRATGAMTVAEYMSEVLTHPLQGYYTRAPGIGDGGDFVTAPELSGMYGEMLGVWLVHEWQKLGAPQPLQLVELGPGRGSLASDILKVMDRLVPGADLSVHLVEVSRQLALTQAETLGVRLTPHPDHQSAAAASPDSQSSTAAAPDSQSPTTSAPESQSRDAVIAESKRSSQSESEVAQEPANHSRTDGQPSASGTVDLLQGVTTSGRQVHWHARLQDVPEAFSLYVANEFFDTMPVHQFRRTDQGWREVLVDVEKENHQRFRFVLARGRTPACQFIDEAAVADRDELEVCPRAAVLAALLADRVAADGGAALVCDYGHTGDRGDTLRAFRKHKCVDPLVSPGGADITCDVDFSALAAAAGPDVLCLGPVSQREFLQRMGLGMRVQRLLTTCSREQADQLRAAFELLTGDMGQRFKVWAMLPATCEAILKQFPPAGFTADAAEGEPER